jgi:hypothetical protein
MQASDISGASIPSLDPEARYVGRDASELVRVEIDGSARYVAVSLERGWRPSVGGDGLGAAILAALTSATTARLTAWAEQTTHLGPIAPASVQVDRPHATPETFRMLSRAWHDLQEYRLQLIELHAATTTKADAGRTVLVTVCAGQIAGIEFDPDWLRTAPDADIERQAGNTLSAALGDLARLPDEALEDCPDLRAVLAIQHPETDR